MSSTTIRISMKTHRKLKALAEKQGIPLTDVVDQAVEQYRRKRIAHQADAEYRALRADPVAWGEVQAERAAIDPLLVAPNITLNVKLEDDMSEYLQETLQLAERYGISAEEIGVYLAHAGDRPRIEAACAARARGLTHEAVRQALMSGATTEQLNALRSLNEEAHRGG